MRLFRRKNEAQDQDAVTAHDADAPQGPETLPAAQGSEVPQAPEPQGAAAYVAEQRAHAHPDPQPAQPEPPAVAPAPELLSPLELARVPAHARDMPVHDMPALQRAIVDALRSVYDPEIPVNIYDIGLIYDVDIDATQNVRIRMTLTSPSCPAAESLPPEVQSKVAAVDGVTGADVDLVWEPTWTPVMMSEDARLLLNIM